LRLFLAGDGRDHAGTEGLGEFDGGKTDTACRAEDQHGVTGLDMATILEAVDGGAVGHQQRGAGGVVDAIGQREQARDGGDDLFGKTAVTDHGNDAVADVPA
jgi:hypothetical protein